MKTLDDKLLLILMKQTENKMIAYIMKFIAVYASKIFMTIYGVYIIFLIIIRDPILIPFLVGPLLSLLSVVIIRHFVKRERPFVMYAIEPLISHDKGPSFPSKHGTSAFAIAFAIFWIHPLIGGVAIVLALLTGISRIMVGVHYPSDILAGLLIAIGMTRLAYVISFILL
ncbi:MAG: hypothetical protein CVU95_10045 [Firmicutes bacterium HGW-Firmicutes-2]|jgi:undecaprenyl-diphosphatase|nr:MAG: hypothetical protein CVU95_10045 [Firmicutes bacterium HGW-Firmicutes-2]